MASEVFQPPEEGPVESFSESVQHVLGAGPVFRLYLVYCLAQVGVGAAMALVGLVAALWTIDVLSLVDTLPGPMDPRWLVLFLMPVGLVSIALYQVPIMLGRSAVGYYAGFLFLGLGLLNPLMIVPAVLLLRHWLRPANRPVLMGHYG